MGCLFTFCLRVKKLILVHDARTLSGAAASFLPPLCCSPRMHTRPFTSVSRFVHPALTQINPRGPWSYASVPASRGESGLWWEQDMHGLDPNSVGDK